MKPMHLIKDLEIPAGFMVFADAGISRLQDTLTDVQGQIDSIVNAADEDDRDLTDEELSTVEELNDKVANLNRQITARNARIAAAQPRGRQTKPDPTNAGKPGTGGRTTVPAQPKNERDVQTFGFNSMGEFANHVARHYKGDEAASTRITNATSTYANEQSGAEGGFLVPPEFRTAIWTKVTGEGSLVARTQQFQTGGNSLTFPADETTPWDTTTGVQAYWGGEGDVKTPSKPAFEMKQLRLNKLYCLVPVSDELLEDAAGLESWLRVKAPQKMDARLNTAMVRGNGVGKPQGFLNSGSLITVSKDASQDADTITMQNIVNLWTRMYAGSRANAVWVINQDIEGQLMTLKFPDETGQNLYPVYMPAGGLSASPFGMLLGRPVLPVEAASTLGDKGDISLVDWSQYMTLTKAGGGGVKTDVSIHLYFDQDLTAFRFVLRIAGQPLWNSTISPENGSMTRSWAVTLEDRT